MPVDLRVKVLSEAFELATQETEMLVHAKLQADAGGAVRTPFRAGRRDVLGLNAVMDLGLEVPERRRAMASGSSAVVTPAEEKPGVRCPPDPGGRVPIPSLKGGGH